MRFKLAVILILCAAFNAKSQNANTLKISELFPESVGAGSDFSVDLTFDKPEIQSFAVFKQIFPKGFKVSAAQCANAEFTFDKNEMHFTWLRLPREKHFTVSYKVHIDSTVSGKFAMAGKLTYIVDNMQGTVFLSIDTLAVKKKGNPTLYKDVSEKNNSNTDNKTIVSNSNSDKNNSNVSENSNSEKNNSAVADNSGTEQKKTTVSDSSKVSTNVVCERAMPELNNATGEFTVTLKISKGNLNCAARITEVIPVGFEAREIESRGAVFSFVDNNATLIWNKLPDDAQLTVKYLVIPKDKTNKLVPEIDGQMLYVSGGKVVPMIVKRQY
jgi:hypothetical protein